MHIALLTEKYPPDMGGVAVSAARLAQGLVVRGHTVHVFVLGRAHQPGEQPRAVSPGLTVARLGMLPRRDDSLARWFDDVLAAHQQRPFDLLHGFFLNHAGFVAVYAARCIARPVVVSARGNDLDRAIFDPAKAAHILYALQHADAITANARHLVTKVLALAPDRPVTLIPNGVDAGLFHPSPPDFGLRAALGLPPGPIIGFVGEARAKKGLAPLLLAFAELARTHPATLLLVGGVRAGDDAALLAVFQKQHPELPLWVIPHLPDHTQLPAYYNLLDVVVLPSLAEGLPNALLEAMACGRPVVATPAGGIADVLRHDHNGWLVPAHDVGALVAALQQLLDDPAARARLGTQARDTVLHDYTIEQEVDSNLMVYAALVGDGRLRRFSETPESPIHLNPQAPRKPAAGGLGRGAR